MKKQNFKNPEDYLSNPISKYEIDTEFSSEYLDINPTDVVKDHVNFSELTKIARKNLSKKYSKKQ